MDERPEELQFWPRRRVVGRSATGHRAPESCVSSLLVPLLLGACVRELGWVRVLGLGA